MTDDPTGDWETQAARLGYDLTPPSYPGPWEPHPRMYGWRQRREHPTPEDVFQQQHLRFVAAWAVSDLEQIHRRGWLKRILVCWWAHRDPARMCVWCAAGWGLS